MKKEREKKEEKDGTFSFLVECRPMRKFSGLTSLKMSLLECTYSMRDICPVGRVHVFYSEYLK